MSCLFDSIAHAVAKRPGLVRCARYQCVRDIAPITGATIRAAACELMRLVRVHELALCEWGAMETGGTADAYVDAMRGASTWGGGVELAALAAGFRVPIRVEGPMGSFAFGEKYVNHAAPISVAYTGAHYAAR
jgi:hypothetical protein